MSAKNSNPTKHLEFAAKHAGNQGANSNSNPAMHLEPKSQAGYAGNADHETGTQNTLVQQQGYANGGSAPGRQMSVTLCERVHAV